MDGTQIIRKASFASQDPKKYGLWFTRLTVENLIPYKVFNRVEAEVPNIKSGSGNEKVKYVKVFYDTTTVVMNYANEIFPQGTGPLFLKSFDSVYKFKFEKIDVNGDRVNVDLSGAFNYAIQFKLDDNNKIEVGPTYSTNMNTTIGEIEFKLTEDQLTTLKKQTNNNYSIIVKNPNGTSYTFYEGTFYDISNEEAVITQYQNMYTVTDLQAKNAELQAEVQKLTDELATLKAT
jgi:CDP-glycerol glycerophosphotransferase (TagB/SpsB family)